MNQQSLGTLWRWVDPGLGRAAVVHGVAALAFAVQGLPYARRQVCSAG